MKLLEVCLSCWAADLQGFGAESRDFFWKRKIWATVRRVGKVKDPVTWTERKKRAGKSNAGFVISVRQFKKKKKKEKKEKMTASSSFVYQCRKWWLLCCHVSRQVVSSQQLQLNRSDRKWHGSHSISFYANSTKGCKCTVRQERHLQKRHLRQLWVGAARNTIKMAWSWRAQSLLWCHSITVVICTCGLVLFGCLRQIQLH